MTVTKLKSQLTQDDARWEWWEMEGGIGAKLDDPVCVRGALLKDVPTPPPGYYYHVINKRKLRIVSANKKKTTKA